MSQKLKKYISLIISLAVAIILILYIKNNWTDFQSIKIISWPETIILFLLTPMFFLIQGLIFKTSLAPFKLKLPFKDWFGLTILTLLGNLLIPLGGFGFRFSYLKKRYNFNYSDNLITTSAIWIFNLAIFSLAGLLGLLILYWQLKIVSYALLILFGAVLAGCFIIWFLPLKKFQSNLKFFKIINHLFQSWRFIKRRRKIIYTLVQLTFLELIFLTMVFYFAFRTFGFIITPWAAILPACLSIYSFLIRLIPASLGIYEAAIIIPATFLGFSIAEGLSVAILTRLVNFFWIFVLSLIFGYILIRKKK